MALNYPFSAADPLKQKNASAENQTRASRSLHVFAIHRIPLQPPLLPFTSFSSSLIFFLRAECLFSIGPFWRSTPTHP